MSPPEERHWLAARFEEQRPRLRAVAYRMLGSLTEAEDAVQEAWLRLSRTGPDELENLGGWLTTVVARISLNVLRARKARNELPMPEPIIDPAGGASPEHATLLADSVGLALLMVLETLSPAERVAFVLHDIFDMPFDQIASIVQRTPEATRQLASRGRRRIHESNAQSTAAADVQRRVVDAFLAAAHQGDLQGLLAVLDPQVILRSDAGASRVAVEVHGAEEVAGRARSFSQLGLLRRPVLVNGVAGAVCLLDGKPFSVMAFTVRGESIIEIAILRDAERLAALDLTALDG